jgi:DNA-binding NarL/FixJ family response regulator
MAAPPFSAADSSHVKEVLVVDDHPMFRHGLARILEQEPRFRLAAEASNFKEALTAARERKLELALLDVSMPGINGIELIKALRAEHPELRMLVLSMHDESLYALRAIRAGALGFVSKDDPYETLVEAIHRVAEGRLFLRPELMEQLLLHAVHRLDIDSHPDLDSLSRRELEVLGLYGQGVGTEEICARFGVGVKTVETYRTRLKAKLGLADLPDLVRFAQDWIRQKSDASENSPANASPNAT